ncbi:hypothetical protein ACFV2S_06635 [Streptomyces sp. NPDC059695]|uniref:hypothetical protein n=1 Tax=Streptomyces sp. NPDC059695 TaxID=3346910 RepID=UPI0036A4AFE6
MLHMDRVHALEVGQVDGERADGAGVVADEQRVRARRLQDTAQPRLQTDHGAPRRLGTSTARLQQDGQQTDQTREPDDVLPHLDDVLVVPQLQALHGSGQGEEASGRRNEPDALDGWSVAALLRVRGEIDEETRPATTRQVFEYRQQSGRMAGRPRERDDAGARQRRRGRARHSGVGARRLQVAQLRGTERVV